MFREKITTKSIYIGLKIVGKKKKKKSLRLK